MKLFICLFLLLPSLAFANFKSCKDGIGEFGNLSNMRYQIGHYKVTGKCFISVGPLGRYPEYRSFSFDSKGELMVFNSLGPGSPSTDTGARNFLFPVISSDLMFELDREEEFIRVKNIDGRVWEFDARSAKIHSITEMDFIEDPQVSRTNNGGLELDPKRGQLIDEGWRLGGPPNIVLSRKSNIKDASGVSCQIGNKKLFKLRLDDRGRVDGAYFIHDTEKKWKKFLIKNCQF